MKLNQTRWLIIPILFAVVACGGKTFVQISYGSLNESKDLYYLAMTATASLQSQGTINQEKRDQINKAAKIYKEAHNLAVDALATYKVTSSAADKDKLIIAISTAASKWVAVAALINAIKPGLVPATFSK